jgi:hypothetical protein
MQTIPASPVIYWLILTYKRPDSLFRLVDTILAQSAASDFEFLFLIWDNAGAGESWERFSHSPLALDPQFDYIRSETNIKMLGKRALEDRLFSRILPGDGDWVAHMDDDIKLSVDWLRVAHRAALENGWDASGSTEFWEGTWVYSGQTTLEIVADETGREELWRWRFETVDARVGPRRVVFAGHRALLVRAAIAHRVRHDPEMTIGGEDLDYSFSLAKAGATIGIEPNAVIHHRAHGEVDAIDFRTRPDVLHSWRTFYRKWGIVRLNAADEAGLSVEHWLSAIRNEPN